MRWVGVAGGLMKVVGDRAPRDRVSKGHDGGGLPQSYPWWDAPSRGEMGRPWPPLRAPGEGLFLRLAALIMFLARSRWLALESRLLTTGDMQRVSLGKPMGEMGEMGEATLDT